MKWVDSPWVLHQVLNNVRWRDEEAVFLTFYIYPQVKA